MRLSCFPGWVLLVNGNRCRTNGKHNIFKTRSPIWGKHKHEVGDDGYESFQEAILIGIRALADTAALADIPPVLAVRSGDWGNEQQTVLKKLSDVRHNGAACVFFNLDDGMPDAARQMADTLSPTAIEASIDKAAVAKKNLEFQAWLISERETIFPTNCTAFCTQHGKQCPLYPGAVWDMCGHPSSIKEFIASATSERSSTADSVTHGKRRKLAREASVCSHADERLPWWLPSRESHGFSTGERPMFVNTAGLPCIDFTPRGSHLGQAGPTNRYHSVWLVERIRGVETSVEDGYSLKIARGTLSKSGRMCR